MLGIVPSKNGQEQGLDWKMKMSEKTTNVQRKPEKLLLKAILKMTRKSWSLKK